MLHGSNFSYLVFSILFYFSPRTPPTVLYRQGKGSGVGIFSLKYGGSAFVDGRVENLTPSLFRTHVGKTIAKI